MRGQEEGLTKHEVDKLGQALEDPEFRSLLIDYCKEIQDPRNVARQQEELVALEKQRGVDLTFINPSPGYVIKSSADGEKKAFINVCSSDKVAMASFARPRDQRRGLEWNLPHSVSPSRMDYDKNNHRCIVFDVVFHPNTLIMASKNQAFKKMLDGVACDAVETNLKVKLDRKNLRFPKMAYKGYAVPAVTRKPDPNYDPEAESDVDPTVLEQLYPQKCYSEPTDTRRDNHKINSDDNITADGYIVPKYEIIHRKEIDMKEFTYAPDAKQHVAIPSALVVEVKLPLLSSSKETFLDVKGKKFSLVSDHPARYKLETELPYVVDDEAGSAKFDCSKHVLTVTLPVIPEKSNKGWYIREDSGVESDTNSPCGSDEDVSQNPTSIVELPFVPSVKVSNESEVYRTSSPDSFLSTDVSYLFPNFTCNSLDNILAITLHVKNVKPDSVKTELLQDSDRLQLKFSSIGAGYFATHYALFLKFPQGINCEEPAVEVWDNNVVMQIEIKNPNLPEYFFIGLNEFTLEKHSLDISNQLDEIKNEIENDIQPSIEVSAKGKNEINISLSHAEDFELQKEEIQEILNPIPKHVDNGYDDGISSSGGSCKGILKFRSSRIGRCLSESSVDYIDYMASPSFSISSTDCIPEELSSLKKTVRFSDTIAQQTFRSNSSILGQKNKNQRKKRNKKRAQERRASEGDPDDGSMENINEKDNITNQFLKSPNKNINGKHHKQRRDSGLTDTDDADTEKDDDCFTPTKSCLSKFFERENISKGKYTEVCFKNDLIFDLDM